MVLHACHEMSENMMLARHEAIMLRKLSIMLLSSAPKITDYTFEKIPCIIP